jgi:hypothetical protein
METINIDKMYNEKTEEEKNKLYETYNQRNLLINLSFHYSMSMEDIKKHCIISEIKYQIRKSIQNKCKHQYYEVDQLSFGSFLMKCSKCNYVCLIK